MLYAILLCCAMSGDGGKPAGPTAADRVAYEAAAGKAGKNASAHVQLALWCEAHGLTAERIKHLAVAVSLDPANTLARGLMGLVAFQGNWEQPEQVKQELQDDPKLHAIFREYLDRRIRTPQKKADAQLHLADWCLEKGLKDEAMAHYHLVTRLDPSRDIAWIRLGYKKHKDRWFKPDDLAAQKVEADRQKRADKEWKMRLEKLREAMESPTETRRLKAERELYQVTDPRALPMIWKIFGNGSEPMQLVTVELLSQIEGPSASFCLAVLAIEKPSPDVRKRAAQALMHRDPRDIIGWLINVVRRPFKYEVKPGDGPGSTGVLMVDGERFDIRRFYRFPEVQVSLITVENMAVAGAILIAPTAVTGPSGKGPSQAAAMMTLSGRAFALQQQNYAMGLMNEAIQRDQIVQQKLESDVQTIEEVNAQINETNERVLPLLEALTGQNLGAEPGPWQKWWADQLGYVYDDRYAENKPAFTDFVSLPNVVPHHACFGAGTLVQTLAGPRKIESIAVGDRVLSQQTSTGALSFQPVLATHINGPSETFRIAIDGETIVATGIHRFWKAGKGWTMARDLIAGDRVRMIGGIASIQSIEPGATQMVYNLDVAGNRDFLVGSAGLLVHDFSFVQPVAEPFDRQSDLTPAEHR
jgi:tetratricopeptide (TPR) repeat protein